MEKRNLLVVGCILIMSAIMMTYYLNEPKNEQEQESLEVYQQDDSLSTVEVAQRSEKNDIAVVTEVEESKGPFRNMAPKQKETVEEFKVEPEQEDEIKVEKEDNKAKEVESEAEDTTYVRRGMARTKGLNVRKKPVKDAKVVLIIEKDTQFDILSETFDGWYEIDVNGIIGYAYSEYITLVDDRVES